MNNDITPMNNLPSVGVNPQASLLEIRMDSKTYPRLSAYTREQAIMQMAKVVSQAFLYRGQTADPQNIQFISTALIDELLEDRIFGVKHISFAEISRVVKRAVLGGSEMFGISVASLYKVIMEYVKGEGHRLSEEAHRLKRQQSLQESPINPMVQAYTGALLRNTKKK